MKPLTAIDPSKRTYETLTPEASKESGFAPMTSTYQPSEYWMMERVISDLKRSGIAHCLVVENPNNPKEIAVHRKGIKEVGAEN